MLWFSGRIDRFCFVCIWALELRVPICLILVLSVIFCGGFMRPVGFWVLGGLI